jgi:predicted ArsR family transcriptional regulator
MQDTEQDRQIDVISALGEPVRHSLYRYVVGQGRPVGRNEAAQATGVSRALASFHLDKLVQEGLLDAEYRRLTGRAGPGAGRPSKLYRRSRREFEISLPPRSYELAARLFARTLARTESEEARTGLHEEAYDFGRDIGEGARELADTASADESRKTWAETLLATYGFEPYEDEDGTIRLRNCPFHALANEHRALVCGMNLAIMRGVVDGLGEAGLQAVLEPAPGRCCVAFRQPAENTIA